MWSSRSATFRELGRSCGAVLVHCKATSSTWNMDDSWCGASGFRAGSSDSSRCAVDDDVIRDRTHLTISMSPSKLRSVGINPLTSSIRTIPMLYTSLLSVAFRNPGRAWSNVAVGSGEAGARLGVAGRIAPATLRDRCLGQPEVAQSWCRCSPWLLRTHPNRIFFTATVSPVGNSAL
ncbi:hypothetical protein OPV22_029441 [Ensete ventricosum]|uniref:Uncharacterized protein n=1 Tax=Ensete ventricosum TaxID=4639 RepID=A0AAV8Q5W5_ENSVE|nr:hypothetical protein OPV22_029441 [Ensete ventricosum]